MRCKTHSYYRISSSKLLLLMKWNVNMNIYKINHFLKNNILSSHAWKLLEKKRQLALCLCINAYVFVCTWEILFCRGACFVYIHEEIKIFENFINCFDVKFIHYFLIYIFFCLYNIYTYIQTHTHTHTHSL